MGFATLQLIDKALVLLMGLLVIGYVSINFMLEDAPRFLIVENIILAIVYGLLIYGILSGQRWAYPVTVLVAAFNAGRVSRSVITPEGTLAELAVEHVPLLLLILIVAILAAARCTKALAS